MKRGDECEKGISDIVGVFTDPIIVYPGGWGDSLPEWIKPAITLERLIENVKSLRGESPTASDAEACAYLFTVSLSHPISSDWTQIYLHVAGKVYERHRTKESGATMPDDIRVDSLDEGQMRDLQGLKHWIYERRIQARRERHRSERRERREQETERKAQEQPALFHL